MFNFKSGTPLAVDQDRYIQVYRAGRSITPGQLSELENNAWVLTASKVAPGNLVVRQWCLIDLFKEDKTPAHKDKILDIIDVLSYKQGDIRIWAEGYSYFDYTYNILIAWLKKFEGQVDDVVNLVDKIKKGFIATAYLRAGVWYPAPFGDLRNQPLALDLQVEHKIDSVEVSIVRLFTEGSKIWYEIKGQPIGLNTHIPLNNAQVTVVNGNLMGFKYYEGYDKKYKNSWQEFLDTMNIKRIRSIP